MSGNEWESLDDDVKKGADAGYEVGYGKPPKQHQFKKGAKSPNPKGRRKGGKGLKTIVCAAAEAPMEYVIHGKKAKAPRIVVALHQLALKAAKGDIKAIEKLTLLYGQHGPPSAVDDSMIDSEADSASLNELIALATKFKKCGAK